MLVGLQILHLFWTYYIGKAFVEVSVSEKLAENNYEWFLSYFYSHFNFTIFNFLSKPYHLISSMITKGFSYLSLVEQSPTVILLFSIDNS